MIHLGGLLFRMVNNNGPEQNKATKDGASLGQGMHFLPQKLLCFLETCSP